MKRVLILYFACVLFLSTFASAEMTATDDAILFSEAVDQLKHIDRRENVESAQQLFKGITSNYNQSKTFAIYASTVLDIYDELFEDALTRIDVMQMNSKFVSLLEQYDLPDCTVLQKYIEGRGLEDEGKYDEAVALYAEVYLFDSADRMIALMGSAKAQAYTKAEALFKAGKYEEALKAFTALGKYKDSAERAEKVAEKVAEIEKEKEREAAAQAQQQKEEQARTNSETTVQSTTETASNSTANSDYTRISSLSDSQNPVRFDLAPFVGGKYQDLLSRTSDLRVLETGDSLTKLGSDTVSVTAGKDGTITRVRLDSGDRKFCVSGICTPMSSSVARDILKNNGYTDKGYSADGKWRIFENSGANRAAAISESGTTVDRIYFSLMDYLPVK